MKLEEKFYSNSIKVLDCKDYLVSKQTFELYKNEKYNLIYTSPIPSNLSKYYESEDYISHSNKQKGFITFLYRLVQNYSFKKKEKLIRSFGLEKKILDVGCGVGSFLTYCKSKQWKAFGTEPNTKARSIAKSFGVNASSSLESLEEEYFSIITLWHVLEHIPNLTETISLLKMKLKEEGRLIIAVPNFESWDANHYKEFWAAYDVPRHLWHFSKESLRLIFEEFDMEVEKILPMKFDAFYVSLLSEKHKTNRSNFISAFFKGLYSNYKAKRQNNYSSLIYVIKNK